MITVFKQQFLLGLLMAGIIAPTLAMDLTVQLIAVVYSIIKLAPWRWQQ